MKRFYISLLAIVFAALQVIAAPVDPEKALKIANEFWASKVSLKQNVPSQLVMVKGAQKAPSHTASPKAPEAFYVFTDTDNYGFVIVSGEDQLNPIVGYSENAVSGEMPPALSAWLDEYRQYVNDVRLGKVQPLQQGARLTSTHIEPMLVTAWGQDEPYNNICPVLPSGQKGYTGCGNTATAQVMKFHEWPASPIADVEWTNNITGQTEFCELKSHVYDWDNMKYNYKGEYSQAEADAVALLMADLGKSTQSTYEVGGTGCKDHGIVHALVHVYDYSPEITIADRRDYTYEEYVAIIRENLDSRLPIIYCGYGQNYNGGHAFVCDGIDENNLLHIDWGWNGVFNGYFDMAMMEPAGNGIGGFSDRYNVGQTAIVNIKPRAEGEENSDGVLTLMSMNIYDTEAEKDVDELTAEFEDGMADLSISFTLMNKSHSNVEGSLGIGIMDRNGSLVKDIEFGETTTFQCSGEGTIQDGYTMEISNDEDSEEYLPVGKYIVGLFFLKNDEELIYMRGSSNGLILNVTESAATLSSVTPIVGLDEFNIVKMPEHSNESLVFNATFSNSTILNSLIVAVPVINLHNEEGAIVESKRVKQGAVAFEVLDVSNVAATFTVPHAFAQSGTYSVSFEYHTTTNISIWNDGLLGSIDDSRLKPVAGQSKPFDVEIIPVDVDEYDYNFSIDLVRLQTVDEGTYAVMRTNMGKDISEYRFIVTDGDDEDIQDAIQEMTKGDGDSYYSLNQSAEFMLPLEAEEFTVVVVFFDVNGELIEDYYTKSFNVATGVETVEGNNAKIKFDAKSNTISVAKAGVIELLDASGRLVKRANTSSLSIADLQAGIYIVKYSKNTIKVVKK